jgi:NADPH2:quinone reductase
MKAIQVHNFGGPEVLQLEEIPTPKPGKGEVLVRVKAAGVNPYDTYMRAGTYAIKPPLPYTPGSDAAGVVEAV